MDSYDNDEQLDREAPTPAAPIDAVGPTDAMGPTGRPSGGWRPGSPVMPMGGFSRAATSAGGGSSVPPNDPAASWSAAIPPAAPEPDRRHRRLGRHRSILLSAASLVVAGGAGAGITYAFAGTSSVVTAAAPGSSSGGIETPINGGGAETPIVNPFGGGNGGTEIPGYGESPEGSGSTTTPVTGAGSPSDVSAIASKVDPFLVDINSTFNYQSASGAGTGIVLTSNGEVITNNHVINGATSISVTDIGNGKTYKATVVGYDDHADVAVLQLEGASGLKTASIASSSATVGEPVVAIGNAGGKGGTPTAAGGSITATDQSVTAADDLDGTDEQLTGLLATDADVQAGDSGGSLVNANGQVVGIDTAGPAGSSFVFSGENSQTSGYAIPIETALSIAKKIEAGTGSSTIHVGKTAFLGILIDESQQSSNGFGSFYGGSGEGSSTSGTTIGSVVAGGAAAKAGLTAGDVITSFDGKAVTSDSTISSVLVPLHPGDKVSITWTDPSGQSHTGTVVLGSGPPA